MGLVFGALTSLSIGMSDLFGRRVVNARGPIVAGAAMQLVAVVTSLVAVGIVASDFIVRDVAIGLASGVGLGIGLWGYFAGVTAASSTIVSPLVATMSAVIPYGYAVVRGAEPAPLAVVGAVVAVVGLIVITFGGTRGVTSAERWRSGLRWGTFSGLGYGFGLSIVIEASEASGAWPSVGQRIAAFALMVTVAASTRLDVRPPSGLRLSALAAGVMAGLSTIFYLFGVQADTTSAVVMASLFPAVSVVVGRFVYGDHVVARQVAGIGVVLVGVVAVSIG